MKLLLFFSLCLSLLAFCTAAADESWIYRNPAAFQDAILKTHNRYRSQHSAPPLRWNQQAANYAAKVVNKCVFQHSGGPYGENLALGFSSPSKGVSYWGDERKYYNWANPGPSSEAGHFTAMVWRASTSVGCAAKLCNFPNMGGPTWFLVCEYSETGNVLGKFASNVLPQKKYQRSYRA